eukprot:TRINITY_DN10592_c0_g1_i10.p1 TRINITY_DN10592_c0_g1~~TRINITY_DN10592_c0_g1_i10.p1  ORF type:complete len:136 (-),score=66.02 TRINITY_DN10592_c0_g1_i10:92-442(-)
MIRRPPRSTPLYSSAASDVYKRQVSTQSTWDYIMGKEIGKKAPIRLWVKAKFMGFRRGKHEQHERQSLLKLEGVNDSRAATYYFGKRVVYIYRAKSLKKNTKYRTCLLYTSDAADE